MLFKQSVIKLFPALQVERSSASASSSGNRPKCDNLTDLTLNLVKLEPLKEPLCLIMSWKAYSADESGFTDDSFCRARDASVTRLADCRKTLRPVGLVVRAILMRRHCSKLSQYINYLTIIMHSQDIFSPVL